ncbi:MAG TPA: hypothetical protein VEM93_07845 [Actinomycetota bacterium]|nr:hypothetical protein [Actinomycetota bacterium]
MKRIGFRAFGRGNPPIEMQIVASPEVAEYVQEHGGLLFVRTRIHGRHTRVPITVLEASTEPPPDALEYQRVQAGRFLLFLDPTLRRFPRELHLTVRGWFRRGIRAYWDGCAFVL